MGIVVCDLLAIDVLRTAQHLDDEFVAVETTSLLLGLPEHTASSLTNEPIEDRSTIIGRSLFKVGNVSS